MGRSVTDLILEWQAAGDPECLRHLVEAVRPISEATATKWLERQRMLTAARIDEIVSNVLDHVRRLNDGSGDERTVMPFRPEPHGDDAAGLRYVRWLSRRRSQDLVRKERRRLRRLPTLTEAGLNERLIAARSCRPDAGMRSERVDGLRRAVESLAAVDRALLERMLDGDSQTQIASSLGVSKASVTRRKKVALTQLRRTLVTGLSPCARAPQSCGERARAHREDYSLQFVGIQYAVRHDVRTVIHRNYRWFMFGCVAEGDVDITWTRNGVGRTSVQRKGTCNFFPPEGVEDDFIWKPSRATEFHALLVPPECFQEAAASEGVGGFGRMRPVWGFADPEIAAALLSLRRHKGDGDDLALECHGRRLVVRMLELLGCGQAEWLRDEGVFVAKEARRICEYIDAHLCGRITLRRLAQESGLSPGHFNRKCHRSFGVTPSRLVSIRRIQQVVDLLRTTDDPVEAIARRTGFCSPSHCTNTFRSILGMPPSHFRDEVSFR